MKDIQTHDRKIKFYILNDDKTFYGLTDVVEWGMWYETSMEARTVNQTKVNDLLVSSVFLSLDQNLGLNKNPKLFETAVFTEDWKCIEKFFSYTWKEAELQHDEIVKKYMALKNN